MLLASITLGAASCAKENVNTSADGGKPTSMSIRMSFPKSGETRATGDTNATDAEAAVKTVDVYIFNDTGAYQSHTALQAADFTATTGAGFDAYTANATIPTTTGKKSVLVGVNLPTKAATSLEGQTVSRVSTSIQTLSIQSPYSVATSGLPMFSTAAVEKTLDANLATNTVDVQVKRLVAKVTVERATNMTQEGVSGTLGALSFAISNQNTKFYLLQGAAPQYQDPNWYSSSYDENQFAVAADADYVAVADGPQSPVSNYNALYAMENTSDEKTGKELTRVTVKATFIPTSLVTAYTKGSKTVAESTNPNNTPTTFYKVTVPTTGDIVYFNDQTNATDYAADMAGTLDTYTDGMCYWYIFLNKSGVDPNQWDVLRNDFYQCSISRIVAPGHSTADLSATAQATTPENDTAITVNVDVLNWNTPVQDSYVLEP